jgi:membrane-bound lytic murein transglycosylase B
MPRIFRCAPRRALALALLSSAALLLSAAAAEARPQKKPSRPKAVVRDDAQPDVVTYGRREDVQRFAAETAAELGLERSWVEGALARARFQPAVTRLIMPPPVGTPKNWGAYRARFVEPERVRAGAAFWRTHERLLDAAHARYGVPPEIVIGILGVETYYGRLTGGFRVLDALATLSFDFPAGRKDRSPFFRSELQHFLLLADQERFEPASVKGSFAGAIGLGQFMPGSILRFAVDGDDDGHVDMASSAADVIFSIAHYLSVHGWQPGVPTHYDVKPPEDDRDRAILPSFSATQFAEHGAELDEPGRRHDGLLALVTLDNGGAAPTYIAGTQNFYAVTRYNWSSYYALAVIDLGRAVAALRG